MNKTNESVSTAPRTSKKGVTVGVVAGLVGGAAVGLAFGVPGLSSAADSDIGSVAVVQQTDDPDGVDPSSGDRERPDRGVMLREMLQPLVDDGTISSGQADAVAEHIVANAPEKPQQRGPGMGQHKRPGGHGGGSEAVLELLGLDAEELGEQLKSGQTLAEIAEANGVATQTLIDTLVAEAQTRIDAAIESGKVDADKAAERAANLEEKITARVNREKPE